MKLVTSINNGAYDCDAMAFRPRYKFGHNTLIFSSNGLGNDFTVVKKRDGYLVFMTWMTEEDD